MKVAFQVAFSLTVLAVPIIIWFYVIRPRLQGRLSDTYEDVKGFWARQWARVVAFRTYVIITAGIYLSEVPALLEILGTLDLSALPEGWQSTIRICALIATLYVRARATTPASEKS